MSLLSWFCTHKYNSWKPVTEHTLPKNRAEAENSKDCMWVRMCIRCGVNDYKTVHELEPEVFHRAFDGGGGVDVEIAYQKCARCGEEIVLTTHYDVE